MTARGFASLASAAATLLLLSLPGAAADAHHPKALVGHWQMEASPVDGFDLRSDGSATFNGDKVRWSVSGDQLTVGGDTMAYQLQGGKLLLSMGSATLTWVRAGQKGATPEGAQADARSAETAEPSPSAPARRGPKHRGQQRTAAPPPDGERASGEQGDEGRGPRADPRLVQLLTASAWCSFHYSQAGGTTSTTRVVMHPNGTYEKSGSHEMSSSGYAGQAYVGSQSQSAARWKVEGQRFFVDEGAGWQEVPYSVARNSNGYPIVTAAGVEYSQCR